MEFDKEQHGVPGSVPEYGAIFMLSSATKRECFRQRLVGVPAFLGHFVKHVKAGMILFLFEYEKRKLHGVFRACSDGAENIVPHAFQSSRKQFPAQVKFTPIWSCRPLIEAEFRDAIKENYFSAKKFNFGLSEEQVHRLLCLFSLRKVTDDLPQRRTNEIKVAGACTMGKVMRYDNGGVVMSDNINDRDYSDDYHILVVSTDDTWKSSGRIGREHDEGRFAKIHGVENKPEVYTEPRPVTLDEYFGDSLANVGRDGGRFAMCERTGSECTLSIEHGQVPDHGRFAKTNRLACEHDMDKEFVPPFPTEHRTVSQPNLHRSIYSNKFIWETDSGVQDQIGTHSTFSGSSEPQISYPLPSTLGGDAIGTSTHPFDPDLPGINSSYSSSSAIVRSSHSFQECTPPPYRMHAGNLISSPKNQSYFLSDCMKKCPYDSSGFGNHAPFSTPKRNEDFNYRTSLPFSGASYSESLATEFPRNQSLEDLSFSWCPAGLTLSETRNNGSETKGPPSYSSSPSIYPFDYSFPVKSQGKLEHEGVRREEKNKWYTSNIPLLNDGQVLLHGFDCSPEHKSLHHHESKSLNHDRNSYSYSENMPSICEKSMNSVFSRLASSSYVCEQGNGDDVGHEEFHGDKAADDVMAMLRQSRCRQAKIKKYGIYTSPNFDYSFPVESQGKLEHEGLQHEEKNKAFAGNIPLSNEGQVQLKGHDYSLKHWGMYQHDSKSLNHDVNCYQYSENVSSGGEKSRNSVFSRLALASDVYVKENADVGHKDFDGDKPADEVMTMLPQSPCQWAKHGKPRLLVKRYDVENFGNKKQSTFYPEWERDCQEMNLKEMKMNITSTENVNQTHVEGTSVDFKNPSAGGTPYRDFKRRSEVQEIHNDSKGRVCDEIAGSDGLSGEQCKRRKLIRPNFSKSTDVLQQENSVKSKDKTRSCEELVGSEDKENKLSQSVKKLHVIGPISGENKNIDTDVERGSNCVGEPKAGNCEGFFRLECENGKGPSQDALECEDKKESSQEAGIHSACEGKSHNDEDGLEIKDPIAHQLSLGCLIPATSSTQSFIGRKEEIYQIVRNAHELCPVTGGIASGNTMNSLSSRISTMQRVLEESMYISPEEGKRKNQQLALGSIAKQS
ncbi:hypothetical protein F2P56_009568 [Juglans regia]|uniref:Uncharacterized protein LOC109006454 n=2 Tax=Juglans regia TaxID=51240 RepID=A0A2I4GBK5_JUGRE|nr:uncharacterized protein LOC109006454 [Juglans regia]XP_018841282.2 uncharacterized protein LOC109006454 [Juglans regia]KAF5472907.1 hypothetical protein F2P56_009568 [Juglans regia]